MEGRIFSLAGAGEGEVGREVDAVGTHGDSRGEAKYDGFLVCRAFVGGSVFASGIPVIAMVALSPTTTSTSTSSTPGAAAAITATATVVAGTTQLFLASARLGAVVTTLVGLHAPANGLGRHASSDLDVGLFHTHAGHDGPASASSEWGREQPLPVGLGEFMNGDDADPRGVVAAVTWTEANTPSSL